MSWKRDFQKRLLETTYESLSDERISLDGIDMILSTMALFDALLGSFRAFLINWRFFGLLLLKKAPRCVFTFSCVFMLFGRIRDSEVLPIIFAHHYWLVIHKGVNLRNQVYSYGNAVKGIQNPTTCIIRNINSGMKYIMGVL